jgi:2-polyprenyl-3-methyl-5-hydroxy-6-metoxy-1,4-benzoquinol methylase
MATDQELVELQETLYTSKNPTRRWLHCIRRDWITEALHRYASSESRETGAALEVGPGSGVYLPILADLFQVVNGSDIEDAYLKHAHTLLSKISNLSLAVDDITDSKLPEGSFDLILCTEVVEHIPDSQAAIAQMHRLLKPGGVLVLSTPQRYSPLEILAKIAFLPGIIQLVRFIYQESILDSGHVNLMTEAQVRKQLDAAGFSIVEHYKSGMYIPMIAEFTGVHGLSLEQFLEKKLYKGPLDWLLWTQYYISRA